MHSPRAAGTVLLAALAIPLPAASQDIAGCYERSFGIHGDFHLGEWLTLAPKSSSELDFHISFVGVNGHVCTARGIAKRVDSQQRPTFLFERREGENPELSQPESPSPACTLRLVVGSNAISVRSTSGNCHSYFLCGARAGVEVTVPRKSRKKFGSASCAMPES
jgi:hypothetical protein